MRSAIVTGGSRGIGYSVASQLLEAGYSVLITGRNQLALDDAQRSLAPSGPVTTLAFDASDLAAAQAAFAGREADVLVANVGAGFSGSVAATTLDQWNQVLNTNLTSAFIAIQAVLDGMLARKWGRIVTVGSMASHVPLRYGAAYTASKHALLGLTRALAEDTRGTGVTANMVAPAFVRTEMTTQNIERISSRSGMSAETAEKKLAALSSLQRLLEPDEVAAEVMRLVGDESGRLTGTSVPMGFDLPAGSA